MISRSLKGEEDCSQERDDLVRVRARALLQNLRLKRQKGREKEAREVYELSYDSSGAHCSHTPHDLPSRVQQIARDQ
ncbi:hypothetical protein PsAD46_03420 [Pseudovibrio sp. Ad46]|nr:hypothetical protein PsAD46_03420 [Pseudovibrio sp. Ad46]